MACPIRHPVPPEQQCRRCGRRLVDDVYRLCFDCLVAESDEWREQARLDREELRAARRKRP